MITISKRDPALFREKRYQTNYSSFGKYTTKEDESGITLYYEPTPKREYILEDEIASSWLNSSVFYTANDENDYLLGFAEGAMEGWGERFRIANIVVFNENNRGKGIGSKLMEAMETEALLHKAKSILLEVENTNTKAFSFYKSKGYSIIGYDKLAYNENSETMPIYMGKIIF